MQTNRSGSMVKMVHAHYNHAWTATYSNESGQGFALQADRAEIANTWWPSYINVLSKNTIISYETIWHGS